MLQRTFFNELTISIALIVLVVLFLDPFMYWMPDSLVYVLLAVLVLVFVLFAGLVWRERAGDEREEMHKTTAGRIGYLVGVGTLVLGLIVQTILAHVDPWLVAALGAMVLGKLLGLFYARRYR